MKTKQVKLTRDGDTIISRADIDEELTVSQHIYCNGFADLIRTTKTHQAIVCRKCNFRFVFPLEVNTIQRLRRYCSLQSLKVR